LKKQLAIGCGPLLIGWKNSGRFLHRDEQGSKKKPKHLQSDVQVAGGTRGDSFQLYAVLGGRKGMEPSNIVLVLFSACGVITVVLAILLIYRATLSSKEDDQIFIDAAEHHHFEEQKELIARMTRLRMPIIVLIVISAILFLSAFSAWLYRGLKNY
jgi:hypothetical protein